MLKNKNLEFNTFELNMEIPLKIVMSRISQEIIVEEIEEDLHQRSYLVSKVSRMRSNKLALLVVLIEIGREYKSVYDISLLLRSSNDTETISKHGR